VEDLFAHGRAVDHEHIVAGEVGLDQGRTSGVLLEPALRFGAGRLGRYFVYLARVETGDSLDRPQANGERLGIEVGVTDYEDPQWGQGQG
jgi:hypothetical protein